MRPNLRNLECFHNFFNNSRQVWEWWREPWISTETGYDSVWVSGSHKRIPMTRSKWMADTVLEPMRLSLAQIAFKISYYHIHFEPLTRSVVMARLKVTHGRSFNTSLSFARIQNQSNTLNGDYTISMFTGLRYSLTYPRKSKKDSLNLILGNNRFSSITSNFTKNLENSDWNPQKIFYRFHF